jgi:hypothetical protein
VSASILAASAGGLVEQIGSYAGYASVLGLGIMALLYFSQAREVRRLREWAGREPERASELAQRVASEPQRRVVAQPLAPATPAAQQQQSTAALYASVGATPPGVVAPAGQLARPAATPAAGLLPAPGAVPPPGAPTSTPGGLGAAAAGAAAAGAAAAGAASAPQAPGAAQAPGATVPPPAPSPGFGGPAAATAPPPGQPAAATAAAAASTAAAQRSASLSSYANGSTGQDTHESAAARPEAPAPHDDDDDGGLSTGRIAAFVGGGVAVVLVAVVLMIVLTGGDNTQKPNDFGDTPAGQSGSGAGATSAAGSPAGSGGAGSSSLTVAQRRATKVAVLNGTTQTGLARNVGDKIEKARFTLGSIGTNADQQIPTTIVAYNSGHETAARAVAKIVGVPAGSLHPADANASAAADADVVVTVGLDQTG